MAKDHGPSVKDDKQYEALREQGASKEKAARIANSNTRSTAKKGGRPSASRRSQALAVISGPIPAGSPSATARGSITGV